MESALSRLDVGRSSGEDTLLPMFETNAPEAGT